MQVYNPFRWNQISLPSLPFPHFLKYQFLFRLLRCYLQSFWIKIITLSTDFFEDFVKNKKYKQVKTKQKTITLAVKECLTLNESSFSFLIVVINHILLSKQNCFKF
jgi:hypothetical protein